MKNGAIKTYKSSIWKGCWLKKINNQIRELEKKKQKQKNPEHIHTNGLKSLIIYVCWTEAKQLYCFHCMFLYG